MIKLFLTSKGKNPETVKRLEEYVGGFEGKTIAYIPTARNVHGWESWKEGGSWEMLQKLPAQITVVQLEEFENSDPAEVLQGKDIIWFAGGQCGYLMYWVRRTQLDKKIRQLLEQGSIYVGSSAGSMVTAKTLDVVEWYIGEIEHGAGVIPGMGLVDFDIYPHYQDELYEDIKKLYKGNKLYLLKDGEELIVEDGHVTVVGDERILP